MKEYGGCPSLLAMSTLSDLAMHNTKPLLHCRSFYFVRCVLCCWSTLRVCRERKWLCFTAHRLGLQRSLQTVWPRMLGDMACQPWPLTQRSALTGYVCWALLPTCFHTSACSHFCTVCAKVESFPWLCAPGSQLYCCCVAHGVVRLFCTVALPLGLCKCVVRTWAVTFACHNQLLCALKCMAWWAH